MTLTDIFTGEFIGTMILIIFGVGAGANLSLKKSFANGAGWVVTAFAWGFAVAFGVYVSGFFGAGGHLNPAVTIGQLIQENIVMKEAVVYILAQFAGAIAGSAFVVVYFYPHFKETEDAGTKLGVFATGPAIKNTPFNFLSEMMSTFVLVFALNAMGAFPGGITGGLNPLIVGFLIVVLGMSLGGTTGYAMNPARDLGPSIAHAILPIPGKGSSNWGYAWIPVLAPITGGVLATVAYLLLF